MRRRSARAIDTASHGGRDRWLVSYADFITLLFAFFVVLFASSHHDNNELRKMAGAIHKGFNAMSAEGETAAPTVPPPGPSPGSSSGPSPLSTETPRPSALAHPLDVLQVKKDLQSVLGDSIAKQEITMQLTPEGFVISLRELGFFNSGEARLLPGAEEKIKQTGKVLMAHGLELRVEGHSDDQPIHTAAFQSNWELSTARALSVLLLLVNDAGFDPKKVSVSGFGEYKPVASNDTPEGRKMNRRVDLVVVSPRP
jgi:chemotaxis protein MotB